MDQINLASINLTSLNVIVKGKATTFFADDMLNEHPNASDFENGTQGTKTKVGDKTVSK